MDSIKILLLDNKKNLKLKKRINRLLSNIRLKVDFGTSLQDFANGNLNPYDIAIISDEMISRNMETLFGLLKNISNTSPKTQIILLVEEQNIALAAKTLKAGTFHYLKLPGNDEELKLLLEAALHLQPQIIDDETIDASKIKKFGEIIGGSAPMLRVYDQISQAAQTDIPVLILGETGTGKDLAAHTIHKLSHRSEMPYIAVNLGALPSELVGSELYGHEKGAFTGALQQHKGVFEQGNKGTVFLDEIDTMDEKVQVTLLRLLEQKKFKRLGGTRSLHSEARLIAATNEDLDNLVESGIFRPDLFYRLDVFRITIPALRERRSDIPLLVDELLLKYAKRYKKNLQSISRNALDSLINFDWPGNVRELKNAVQRAVLVCKEEELQLEHLPPRFHKKADNTPSLSFEIGTTLEQVEREMVSRALAATNNNRKEAARLLGISRRSIYNKLKKHNL